MVKLLTTLEIIIIVVVLIVTVLFILSWLGIGQNPLEWFRRESIKNSFCAEIISRSNCQVFEVQSAEDLGLSQNENSLKIKRKEIGRGGDVPATYMEICNFLGYTNFNECLKKLCGCKIIRIR